LAIRYVTAAKTQQCLHLGFLPPATTAAATTATHVLFLRTLVLLSPQVLQHPTLAPPPAAHAPAIPAAAAAAAAPTTTATHRIRPQPLNFGSATCARLLVAVVPIGSSSRLELKRSQAAVLQAR